MNKVQPVLLELLREIDRTFRALNRNYSLIDRLAWDAVKFGRFHDRTYDAVVLMGQSAFELARPGLSAIADREIVNASKFSEEVSSWYYMNTQSTLLDLNRDQSSYCKNAAVKIKIIESDGGQEKFFGPDGQVLSMPLGFLNEAREETFEGITFLVSSRIEDFFETVVPDWQNSNWPYHVNTLKFGTVFSDRFSCETFIESLGSDIPPLEVFSEEWRDFSYWTQVDLAQAKEKVRANNYQLALVQERYRLWEEYMPNKEKLLSAWQAGRKEAVLDALSDYIKVLKDYYKKTGSTIYFDEDLFQIVVKQLEDDGFVKTDELLRAIPAQFSKPLNEQHLTLFATTQLED